MSDSATNILVQAAAAFLQQYPPFAQMSPQRVTALATRLKLAYYPMHTTLLDPAHGPGATFFIIQRGRVESRRSQSDELFEPSIQALGVGECFPMSALLGRPATRNTYRALEDTFCYTITAAEFLNLFEEDSVFRDFCTNHLSMLLNQAERVRQGEYVQLVTAQQSLSAPLTSPLKREPISCLPSTALETVLEKMARLNIGAVVIVNETQEPVGIFTERDVLHRVVLARADLHTPIAAFMTSHPVQLPSDVPAYEAALAMATHAIRHIPVVTNKALVGVVSERDLFAIQRHGLHHVSRTITTATTLTSLQQAAAEVRQLTLRLLAQGMAAEPLTRLISALNDRLTQRILALQRATYDLGDIAWCWIALGSEGRSEQTLSTDQDNALIFLPPPHTAVAVTRERLLPFARSVNDTLAQCGFPLCPGNIMASNADWCLSLDEWQARYTTWVYN